MNRTLKSQFAIVFLFLMSSCGTGVSLYGPAGKLPQTDATEARSLAIILTELVDIRKSNKLQFDHEVDLLVNNVVGNLTKIYGACSGQKQNPLDEQRAKIFINKLIDDMVKCSQNRINDRVELYKQDFDCAAKLASNPGIDG